MARPSRSRRCAWLPCRSPDGGIPTTTGLPEIDYFVSCAAMEPPEGAEATTARSWSLLPGLGTRYAMPRATPGRGRADFGLPEDRTLYLVPQSLFKIHPDNDELFAATMAADPRGVLVFFAAHYDAINAAFQGAARGARSPARGIDVDDRAPSSCRT